MIASKEDINQNFDVLQSIGQDALRTNWKNPLLEPHTRLANDGSVIIDDEAIEFFNPDLIDIEYFWKKSHEVFPELSVSGTLPTYTTFKWAIEMELVSHLSKALNAFHTIDFFEARDRKLNLLEIGPGNGYVYEFLERSGMLSYVNYYAIDIYPKLNLDTVYKCNGRVFPQEIMNNSFDVVYAANVFQHLSRGQLTAYFTSLVQVVRPVSVLLFSLLLDTQGRQAVEDSYLQIRNNVGVPYLWFMNQFVEIQTADSLSNILRSSGIGDDVHKLQILAVNRATYSIEIFLNYKGLVK